MVRRKTSALANRKRFEDMSREELCEAVSRLEKRLAFLKFLIINKGE